MQCNCSTPTDQCPCSPQAAAVFPPPASYPLILRVWVVFFLHYIICYGLSLLPVWVSSPYYAPSQLLVPPQHSPLVGQYKLWWPWLPTALLSNNKNIAAFSKLLLFPKPTSQHVASYQTFWRKKINSVPGETGTHTYSADSVFIICDPKESIRCCISKEYYSWNKKALVLGIPGAKIYNQPTGISLSLKSIPEMR